MPAKPIKSLAKAHTVIEALADRGPLTPAEIADAIGAPRSSTYRLIDGLREIDLIADAPGSRIQLSQRWLGLADASRRARTEWIPARAVLERLSERTGLTAQLSVQRGAEAVCVEWCPGRGVELLAMRPGVGYALNAGAAGRILLAHRQDPPEFSPLAYTPATLTTAEELADDRAEILDRGHVLAIDDIKVGMAAVGVPVLTARTQISAALSLTGIADDVHPRLDAALPGLIAAAEEIAAAS